MWRSADNYCKPTRHLTLDKLTRIYIKRHLRWQTRDCWLPDSARVSASWTRRHTPIPHHRFRGWPATSGVGDPEERPQIARAYISRCRLSTRLCDKKMARTLGYHRYCRSYYPRSIPLAPILPPRERGCPTRPPMETICRQVRDDTCD